MAVHFGAEERNALKQAGTGIGWDRLIRPEPGLSGGRDQEGIRVIHGLFYLYNKVGTAKTECVDLKSFGAPCPAFPIQGLRSDEKPRSFQTDFRVRMPVIEGGRINSRLHGRDPANEAANPGGAQGMPDLGFKCGEHGAL